MPSSPIRRLAPLASAAKERDIKVYHLNIGQPDLDSPEIALEAIKNGCAVVALASKGGAFTNTGHYVFLAHADETYLSRQMKVME